MVRQKDPFWEYAEDLKGRFLCKFCRKNYSGGIARVKSHLSKLQGRDIAICNSVPEDIQALALVAVRSKEYPSKKRKASMALTNVEGNGVHIPVTSTFSYPDSSPKVRRTPLLAICNKNDKENTEKVKEFVDRMVAQAFLVNNIPVNTIQSPSFISMVSAIAEFGPGYTLPSQDDLSTRLLHDARTEVDEYVSVVKRSWAFTGCTLMSDIWTDMKGRSFINVIAYSPKGAVLLRSHETDDRNIQIEDILLPVIAEIGSENVVQIVTHSGPIDECAKDLVTEIYPHIYKIQCASRGIHLLLEDIHNEVEWIRSVIEDATSVVEFVYKHPEVLSLMRFHTSDKELKQPREKSFTSNFSMLQSIIEVQNSLQVMVQSPEWTVITESKNPSANNVAQIIEHGEFWVRAKEVISTLEPLIAALHLVDGEGSTAGYLYEAIERVRVEFTQCCSSNQTKYLKLLRLLNVRRDRDILHRIHAAAAFLNPSLMYDGKIKYEQTDIKEGLNYVVERMVSPDERDDFAAQLLLYSGKSLKLFSTLAVAMMKKAHSRVWWEYNGVEVPLLRKIAIRILSQPCSSSSCRESWSAFEVARIKESNKCPQDTLEDFIYMRLNAKMMANYRDREMIDKFPIDFEKTGEQLDQKSGDEVSTTDMNGSTLMLNEISDIGSSSSQVPNNLHTL